MRLIGGRNFNPRARVGRDQAGSPISQNSRYFNPRARVGRDARHRIIDVLHMISIHAPAWGATIPVLEQYDDLMISIHAPAWGATTRTAHARAMPRHFNPRARVGRDARYCGACFHHLISIHAPAWGATEDFISDSGFVTISIHAPAWGATGVS